MAQPVLQALLLADHIYQDAGTNKFVICGVFDKMFLRTRRRPAPEVASEKTPMVTEGTPGEVEVSVADIHQAGNPWVYISITEVIGRQELRLQYVDLKDSKVYFQAVIDVQSAGPLETIQIGVPVPKLPTPHPGVFALELLADGALLGSHRVTLVEQQTSE